MRLTPGAFLLITPSLRERKKLFFDLAQRLIVGNPWSHPDVLVFQEALVGIEQARQVKRFLAHKSFTGGAKMVFIVNGEGLTLEAQNALLKVLEEPSGESYLFIGIAQPTGLLPTVVSRCRMIKGKKQVEGAKRKAEEFLAWAHLPPEQRLLQPPPFLVTLDQQALYRQLWEIIFALKEELVSRKESLILAQALVGLFQAQKMLKNNLSPATVVDWLALWF